MFVWAQGEPLHLQVWLISAENQQNKRQSKIFRDRPMCLLSTCISSASYKGSALKIQRSSAQKESEKSHTAGQDSESKKAAS